MKPNALSTLRVQNVREPGQYVDGGGLILRVHASGSKNWVVRLTIDGKRRDFGIGGYPDVGLDAARRIARDMRKRAQRGEDVRPSREGISQESSTHQEESHTASAMPLSFLAALVIDTQRPTWTAPETEEIWLTSLSNHVLPKIIGDMPVDAITKRHVMEVLIPIKPAAARTVQDLLSTIFRHAI